jgi:hypothetical protein
VSDDYTYYKTSQFIPTKGESYSYYECEDDFQVNRFVTYIPETGEMDKVDVTWTMELREDGVEEVDRDEFEEHWNRDDDDQSSA